MLDDSPLLHSWEGAGRGEAACALSPLTSLQILCDQFLRVIEMHLVAQCYFTGDALFLK